MEPCQPNAGESILLGIAPSGALSRFDAAAAVNELNLAKQKRDIAGFERFLSDFEDLALNPRPWHSHVTDRQRHRAIDLILDARDQIADALRESGD